MRKQRFEDNGIGLSDIFVPVGLHGDGVPYGHGKTKECCSWNVCSIQGSERNLFRMVDKLDLCNCGCGGRCTIDAVLMVFRYCMLILHAANYPSRRHDESPWLKSDKLRAKKKGPLGFYGRIFEFRGDWMMFKQVLSVKSSASEEICWRCFDNKHSIPYWESHAKACWRSKNKL